MAGFIIFVSFVVFLYAVVGVIKPEVARLPNRIAAVGVWALSVVLFIVGGSLAPAPDVPEQSASTPSAAQATTAAAPATPPPAPEPPEADLALVSMRGSDGGYGYHTVEGQVKNLTGANLENVMAVVTWYTSDDEFVTTDDALIEYNPVMSGQVSPFEVMSQSNPAMSRFSVEFKTLFGGTIRYDDQR